MQDVFEKIRARRDDQRGQSLQMLQLLPATADIESQRSLLAIARRHLSDSTVFKTWNSMLSFPLDAGLRNDMLEALVNVIVQGDAPADWSMILKEQFGVLTMSLTDATSRQPALALLELLLVAQPATADQLAAQWKLITEANDQDAILHQLFLVRHQWSEAAHFLGQRFQENPQVVAADWRDHLLRFLIENDKVSNELQIQLLAPTEPEALKIEILDAWNRRFKAADAQKVKAAETLFLSDKSPLLRLQAASYLTLCIPSEPRLTDLFMERFRKTSEEWEAAYLQTLLRSNISVPGFSEKLLPALGAMLTNAQNIDLAKRSLAMIVPMLSVQGPSQTQAINFLLSPIRQNISAELTLEILEDLRRVVAQTPEVAKVLISEVKSKTDDNVIAQILEILAELPNPPADVESGIAKFAETAMKSTQAPLRQAGLMYLTNLQMTPEAAGQIALGIPLLTDTAIDARLRSQYAFKLARCTNLAEADRKILEQTLRKMPDDGNGDEVRTALAQALVTSSSPATDAGEPDWASWLDRVQNEKPIDGMVPAVYLHYSRNPLQGHALLKAMLIKNVYGWPNLVRREALLEFMLAHNGIDAEIVNYAIDFLLTKDDAWGDMDFHLMLLKNFTQLSSIADRVWLVFERTGNQSRTNQTLLREVLVQATGHDKALAEQIAARMQKLGTAADLLPYLEFLKANAGWAPTKNLIASIEDLFFAKPALEESGNRDLVNKLRLELELDVLRPGLIQEKVKKAGLLDD